MMELKEEITMVRTGMERTYGETVTPDKGMDLDAYVRKCRVRATEQLMILAREDLFDAIQVHVRLGMHGVISGGWTAETPECEGKRHSGLITEE